MSATRRCSYCHNTRPLTQFNRLRDGRGYYCKSCLRLGCKPREGVFQVRRINPQFFTVHAPTHLGGWGRIVATETTRAAADVIRDRLAAEADAAGVAL